jgi:hypothetical protein
MSRTAAGDQPGRYHIDHGVEAKIQSSIGAAPPFCTVAPRMLKAIIGDALKK